MEARAGRAEPGSGAATGVLSVDYNAVLAADYAHAMEVRRAQRAPVPVSNPCNCIGPQGGEPLCPCAMRGVIVRDSRYVLPERDLGPVAATPQRGLFGSTPWGEVDDH